VIRLQEDDLQAEINNNSSMRWSFIECDPDWIRNTSESLTETPSSTLISAFGKRFTVAGLARMPSRSMIMAFSSGWDDPVKILILLVYRTPGILLNKIRLKSEICTILRMHSDQSDQFIGRSELARFLFLIQIFHRTVRFLIDLRRQK
jgi:hypothetical protein